MNHNYIKFIYITLYYVYSIAYYIRSYIYLTTYLQFILR